MSTSRMAPQALGVCHRAAEKVSAREYDAVSFHLVDEFCPIWMSGRGGGKQLEKVSADPPSGVNLHSGPLSRMGAAKCDDVDDA